MSSKSPQFAFVSLTIMLFIGAIGTAISVSLLLYSISAGKTSLLLEQSAKAKALANLCAEYALEELREDINYNGNELLNIGSDTCQIFTVLGSGNANRTLQTQANISDVVRKVQIDIALISPKIQLTDWQEVAEF